MTMDASAAVGGVQNTRAPEPLSHQPWKIPAMVEMRVGQHDGVDRIGVNRKRLPVALAQILHALKQATVDQYSMAGGLEQMLRAGHRSRRAETCESRQW